MFGGRYLRQRTALGSESTALQTETTLGLPTGQKRRICGKNVINLLIFGFFLTFLAINLQADLWRILGISLVFFTFFFFSKSKTLQTFLFVIHFWISPNFLHQIQSAKSHSGCLFRFSPSKNFITTDRKNAIPAAILDFHRKTFHQNR